MGRGSATRIGMGLTMSQRRAVTTVIARRYLSTSRKQKAAMLAELCGLTGHDRDHALKALRSVLRPKRVARKRKSRPPVYGPEVIAAFA